MKILKLHRVFETFKRKGFAHKMYFLFWQVLCPYPDQTKIGMWWYGVSGKIASKFYRVHCRAWRKWGWWAKYGHWCQASTYIAIDHWVRGGKIRYRPL